MLETNNLFTVKDQDFATQVLQSDLPVIVAFTAEDWCVHCRNLAPHFARLSQEYTGKLKFANLDVDTNEITPAQMQIQGMPTLVMFAEGKPVGRLVGPHPARLQQGIERLLAEKVG